MPAHKKIVIPGGYLAFPHRIIKRALQLGLSGSQWRALISCVYQHVGNEKNYIKGSFQGGLSMFAKHGSMTRAEAFRAIEFLVTKELLVRVKSKDRRQPAEYKLNLDCCENETVVNSQQSEAEDGAGAGQVRGSQLRKSNSDGCENETVLLRGSNSDGCEFATQYNLSSNSITGFKHFPANNTPPYKSPKGDIAESAKNALPAGPIANQKLSEKEKAKASTPDDVLGFLVVVFRDYFGKSLKIELSPDQHKTVFRILHKSSNLQNRILCDFASACKFVRSNGGLLPQRSATENFLSILSGRKEITKKAARI